MAHDHDAHDHDHDDHDHPHVERRHHHRPPDEKLVWAILLNFAVAGVEVLGGVWSGSLSLLSDALHNSSDAVSLFISLVAVRLCRRGNTEEKTFGYRRAEILAAMLNSAILLVVSFFLFREAVVRLAHPSPVDSRIMMGVAAVALAVNFLSALLLYKDSHDDLNIRSSYLHLVSDALASAAVVAGGACMRLFGWNWADPLLSLVIAVYVLSQGYDVLNTTIRILMQGTPEGVDLYALQKRIEGLDGVQNIHHVHMWQMTERHIHFEAHVNLSRDMAISEATHLREAAEKLLKEEFRVTHSTLQLEYGACENVPLVKP